MRNTWITGILIGVLCGIWIIIIGYTGWYKDPVMMNAFWVVILIQVICLIWGLSRTAKEGNRYWAQVGHGTLASLIGGVILFFVSYLFTAVLFPNYFSELRAVQESMLQAAGKTAEEITAEIETFAKAQTSLIQAISGLAGTLVTGFFASLIIAIFVRNKA